MIPQGNENELPRNLQIINLFWDHTRPCHLVILLYNFAAFES